MGIFSTVNPFDQPIEKVTDEKNTGEDWGLIMEICDRVGSTTNGPKECLKAIVKRLNHQDPHVVMQAITLLDACVNNCGRYFLLEIASREFETEFKKLLQKSHPKIQEKLKQMLKTWAEGEFKSDPQYSLIPSLYSNLKREGIDFSSSSDHPKKKTVIPKDPNVVSSQQEEDDIAKAIQLSLQESKSPTTKQTSNINNAGPAGASSLYPTESLMGSGTPSPLVQNSHNKEVVGKEEKKARALYDFEAAEDNELTFHTGEMIVILDDSDPNWWKGSNHRGEGLFPANFVTTDLTSEVEAGENKRKSVQFNEEVEVKTVEQVTFPAQTTIEAEKIDELLAVLHDADPTNGSADPPVLPRLEDQVGAMGPLIDQELERVDRRHAQLTRLSHELVDALSLYHSLMREMPGGGTSMVQPGGGPSVVQPTPGVPQHGYPALQYPGYIPGMVPHMGVAAPPHYGGYMEPQGHPTNSVMSPPGNSYNTGPPPTEQPTSSHNFPVSAPPPTPPLHTQETLPQNQPSVYQNGPGYAPLSMAGQPPSIYAVSGHSQQPLM